MNKEKSLFTRFKQLNTLYKFLGGKKYSYITLVTINQCTGFLGNLGIGISFNLLINGLLEKKTELFIRCGVFIAVLFTFILTLFPYLSFKTAMLSKRIIFDLRKDLYAKLTNIEYQNIIQSRQNIFTNLTSDVESVSSFFDNTLPEIIFCLVYFLGTFFIMLYLNALIVVIILVSALVVFSINNRYSQKIDESNQNIKERNEEVVETYHQTQSAIRTIKIYLLESKVIAKFSQTIDNLLGEKRKQVKLFNRQKFLSGILTDVSGWGSYLIGAVFVSLGMMNLGNVVLFAQVQNGVLNLFNSLPNLLNGISNTIVSYERIQKFTALDSKEQPEATCNLEIVSEQPAIQVEDLSFSYDKIASVLNEAKLTIQKGSTNAIIARNGSGKSTFMRLLTRLIEPDHGIIRIFGTDISRYDTTGLQSMIHYVEQNPYLFSISVKDSICLGNNRINITDEEVMQAARLACIHERIMEMPAHYDTILYKKEINLSKGERQRIALARMFLSNAELVVFDEAMSAIDTVNASRIIENIKVNKGKTVIYICHDIATMPDVDYVYYLNDGQFVMLDKDNIWGDEFLTSFYTLNGRNRRTS